MSCLYNILHDFLFHKQNIAKHVIKYMFANTTKKYAFVNEVNFQKFCYCPDLIKIV